MILFELVNLLFCILITSVLIITRVVRPWVGYVFIISFFTPLLLNGALLPDGYMPDQNRYFHFASSIRDFNFIDISFLGTVELSSWILAFIPIPFIESLISLGFSNRLLFVFLFVWLYKKQFMPRHLLLFLLFYPSLILYTSLALRETLVMVFMIVGVVFYIEKKYFYSIIWILPLAFIKLQNLWIIVVFFLLDFVVYKKNINYIFRYAVMLLTVIILSVYINSIIEVVDFYRWAMFYDDGGSYEDYIPITTIYEFIKELLLSPIYFILKPLPWEASSLFQFVQSIENILLIFYIYYVYRRTKLANYIVAQKWLVFMVFSFGLYGMVIFNYGSAVRYKVPLVVLFLIAMTYDEYRSRK